MPTIDNCNEYLELRAELYLDGLSLRSKKSEVSYTLRRTRNVQQRTEPLLSRRQFMQRLVKHGQLAGAIFLISLVIGTFGFHWLAPRDWLDSFLNASMLLGGMGPIGEFERPVGKIFAALYALYAGIAFLGASAVLLTPIVHQILHKLHLDEQVNRK